MSALRRTEIGPFTVADALDFDSLTADVIATHLAAPLLALQGTARRRVSTSEERRLRNGLAIAEGEVEGAPLRQGEAAGSGEDSEGPTMAALSPAGELVALLRPGASGELRPYLVFPRDDATA